MSLFKFLYNYYYYNLQRKRKERKLYSDDWALGDEEIEGHHTFDLEEKVRCDRYDVSYVKNMEGVGKKNLYHIQVFVINFNSL